MKPRKSVIERNKRNFNKLLELRKSCESSPAKKVTKKKFKKKRKKRRKLTLKDRRIGKWKNYKHYCNSQAFRIWKVAVLRRDKYKCRLCGEKAVTAHHIRYRKWGTERLEDGLAVCMDCHTSKFHVDKDLDKEYKNIIG